MRLSAEEAFRSFGDRVFSAAFSVTGNKEDADDVVQDTFLQYCSQPREYTDEAHIKAWLLRVAYDFFGRERPLTEEILEHLAMPEVEYREDGRVWVYYQNQSLEITDLFDENGVCFVQLKSGGDTQYLTVKWQDGYATSPNGFVQPETFN